MRLRPPAPSPRPPAARVLRAALAGLALALLQTNLLVATVRAAEPEATASISPSEIRLGERARLTVTISNVQASPPPALPAVDGLSVRSAGQQMSMSIVNGATNVNVTHSFVLEPSRAGEFTIPALRIDIAGRTLSTEAVSLRVLAPGEAPRPQARAPEGRAPGSRDPATLEIILPRRELFVGEVAPAKLRLLIRDGLRVTDASQPVIDAKSFTVNRKPDRQPEQTTTMIDGVRYVMVTFPLSLSPVAAGEQTIDARMELRAILPRSAGRGGAFDDQFFGSFFGGLSGEPKKLDVVAKSLTVRVLPLPDAGRPADFGGAIGRFSIAASAEPTRSALGDPIAVKITVSGDGNFDRVALPPFESDRDWKAYPENATFTASDDLGLSGRKTFDQALVPQRASLKALPIRRFSYFDPESRRYATLSTEPIALAIAPSPERAGARAAAPGASTPESGGDGFELVPNEIAPGPVVSDFRPLATRPAFLLAQGLPVIGVALALVWVRRRDRRMSSGRWQRSNAARPIIRARVADMERAVAAGDRSAFFAAARRAVQEAVAARYDRTAAALTVGEIEACLASAEPDDAGVGQTTRSTTGDAPSDVAPTASAIDDVRVLFAEADATSYAGGAAGATDLDPWRARVLRLLGRLEAP